MDGLKIVYAQTPFPKTVVKTLFLAGPTDRSGRPTAWRQEALQILRDLEFDGHVFIPESEDGKWNGADLAQNVWEHMALERADAIVFWVARDLKTMPGFTTNIEWGQWMQSKKVVLGIPDGAPKTAYMEWCAEHYEVPCVDNLKYALRVAREHIIIQGAERTGADVLIPIQQWRAKLRAPVVYPKPDLTADNVIFNGEDVLLIRRRKDPYAGRWALPGGYINKGEKPIVAAARELQEETGLRAGSLKLVGVYGDADRDPRGWVVSTAYTAESTTREVLAADDAEAASWVPIHEAQGTELAFDHNLILQDALALR